MKKNIIVAGILISLILGGCSFMDKKSNENSVSKQEVAVQDYTGQGFIFIDGDKTKDIVAENKDLISKYALEYFKEKYHTDVMVNNVVPARNAAVVILESKEEPKFNTSVIVSIDMNKKKVLDSVTSEQGSINQSIQTGLYAMAYEDKFSKLDKFVKSNSEKYGFIGLTDEAVKKTRDSGYVTNYYYLAMQGSDASNISNLYMANTNINKDSLRSLFEKEKKPETLVGIVISLYTKDKSTDMDKVNAIITNLKNAEGLPPGAYAVIVNGNIIDVTSGHAIGDSVGTSIGVDEIIKK